MKHRAMKAMKHRDLLQKGAKREGHINVQGQIGLSLEATFKGGEDTCMSIGG